MLGNLIVNTKQFRFHFKLFNKLQLLACFAAVASHACSLYWFCTFLCSLQYRAHINIWIESWKRERFSVLSLADISRYIGALRLRAREKSSGALDGKQKTSDLQSSLTKICDLFDLLQTTRSPNLFEISPRPFAVTTSPVQTRGQFGSFGQRTNFGFGFPSEAQQQQRQNPYIDTTGFAEVTRSLHFFCASFPLDNRIMHQ